MNGGVGCPSLSDHYSAGFVINAFITAAHDNTSTGVDIHFQIRCNNDKLNKECIFNKKHLLRPFLKLVIPQKLNILLLVVVLCSLATCSILSYKWGASPFVQESALWDSGELLQFAANFYILVSHFHLFRTHTSSQLTPFPFTLRPQLLHTILTSRLIPDPRCFSALAVTTSFFSVEHNLIPHTTLIIIFYQIKMQTKDICKEG